LAASAAVRRARERHAGMPEGAASYAGGIAWGLMIGVMAARCAVGRVAWWWHHPRRRRAAAATTAALGLPFVLPLLVLVALSGVGLPTLSALVNALYAQARLDPESAPTAIEAKTLWTRS